MNTAPVLSQIFVYPVKSLRGFQVDAWPVDATGLRHDRKWMLVDEQGLFLSQRKLPRMTLIRTAIHADCLRLSAPGMTDLSLPLQADTEATLQVEVWGDICQGQRCGAKADAWLSQFLQTPCHLVWHADDQRRQVDQKYALPDDQTAYSDGFPFLLVSEASLQAINEAMNLSLSMERFRPNLVVSGCDSYAEDQWRRILLNEIEFRLPKPCSRCSVPAIDPETAEIGKEPLLTLAQSRKWQNKVYFGQNVLHDRVGMLSVGSVVAVLEQGDKQPPLA